MGAGSGDDSPLLGERQRLELAYSLLLSLPGTPVLRYGDEIGMGENLTLRERAAVRTPMQWSAEQNAGFSSAERLVRPVVSKGVYAYSNVNVESQRRDPGSLLRWLIRMIRLRKECPEIGWGSWGILPTRSSHVIALHYRRRGNGVVCVHNFSGEASEVSIRVPGDGGELLTDLIDDEVSRAGRGTHHIGLDAHGYRWYRVGRLEYALGSAPDRGP
jgi:maltose alpha-D-glucosyltransferase / alpha-amylase